MAIVETKARMPPIQSKRRRMVSQRRMLVVGTQIAILTALLCAWQFGVSQESRPYFSSPILVGQKLIALLSAPPIYRHMRVTLAEIAVGYGMGAAFGLSLGMVLGRSALLSAIFQPFVIGLYSVPKIALAPVFIVWLGLGMASKVAVVFLSSFFLIFFNTYSGLLAINEELVNIARLMGANWWQVARRVIFPAAASQIFIGLKTAVPYAVIGAVIGEYIGSNEGLGYFILYASQTYDAPALFAGIIILVAIVFATSHLLSMLEGRLIHWKRVTSSSLQL